MDYLTGVMLEILKFFYVIGGHNYGLAIVWLTLAVNFALYPLTLASIKQMSAMQRVQPRIQELQKKHKDEPKKMQQEMMDLYRGEKVNPVGGCLPVLLKIPFFLALFFALQSKEFQSLINQPGVNASFLWVADLSQPEHLALFGIKIPFFAFLIGVTTYLMQASMPTVQQGSAQMMTMFMPIFIAFISINFPAGVQIYWLASNLIGGLQQYYITGKISAASKKGGK